MDHQLHVRIDAATHHLINQAAQRMGISQSRFVSETLAEAVRRLAKDGKFSASGHKFENEILRLSDLGNTMIKGGKD